MEAESTIMACFNESMEDKSFGHQESSRSHSSGDSSASDARLSSNACFDCSICLDFAVDPVVTLCGHLYCWPCIYKWLQAETTTPQHCPVCKCPLSQNALVPLYGRGSSGNLTAKAKGLDDIPNRPAVLKNVIAYEQQRYTDRPMQRHHYPSQWGVLGGLAIAILPLVTRNYQGGAGEMYFSRGNHLMPSVNSASQRLQEKRVEDSLHQIWVFLFCCAVLGLLFF